jgi:secreted trypsin-like serine protease
MTRRILLCFVAVLAIGACSDAPTNTTETQRPDFITHGELDGNAHPAVVLVVADVGGRPAFRCSGTLISPKRVVTAGHCTHNGAGEPLITGMRIFTESDVENGNNNFPFAGPNTVEAASWHAHPLFPTAPFFLNDVGIIKLKKAVKLSASKYGALPKLDQLDALSPGNSTRFTAVGYGLQRINPVFVEDELIRMNAEPHLIQINVPGFTGDFSLLLSNNASTGGTCFGDSGGPNYLGSSNVIAGVTSFGLNGNCAGTGGVFRLDRDNVLDFLNDHLE